MTPHRYNLGFCQINQQRVYWAHLPFWWVFRKFTMTGCEYRTSQKIYSKNQSYKTPSIGLKISYWKTLSLNSFKLYTHMFVPGRLHFFSLFGYSSRYLQIWIPYCPRLESVFKVLPVAFKKTAQHTLWWSLLPSGNLQMPSYWQHLMGVFFGAYLHTCLLYPQVVGNFLKVLPSTFKK